ncbi:MAG: hypothetical protein DDT21_01874 [Syntrophomonadaceae bacterium]|nr:hypothetical protein [Bacillota bacterium]
MDKYNAAADQAVYASLMQQVGVMTPGDLLGYLSPETLNAMAADWAARPPQTAEELAYFDAEAKLETAIQKAAEAASKALSSQWASDLNQASTTFAVAADAKKAADQAKWLMDAAFRLSDEYRSQQAEGSK